MSPTILGVNSAFNESSACLLRGGRVAVAIEEERLCRVKHAKHAGVDRAHQLPWKAIEHCLRAARIAPRDVSHVAYSLDPEARLRGNLKLADRKRIASGSFGSEAGERAFYASNLEARRLLTERFSRAQFHFVGHHLCHAASAYLASPFERAAILSVDGIGEVHSTWLGVGDGSRLTPVCQVPYPHSLGMVWEKLSELLGFDRVDGTATLMRRALLTDPRGALLGRDYLHSMREIIRPGDDGSFFVDNRVMRLRTGDFSALERRFGKRRPAPQGRYEDAAIAAALQTVTEEVLVGLARALHRMLDRGDGTAVHDLCVAGSLALNSAANARLLHETPFRRLWVQPAAHDAGTALGAAAYMQCEVLGLERLPPMTSAALSSPVDSNAIESALRMAGVYAYRPDDIADTVAERLSHGEIVGWFQGPAEFGPQALGHRSILADPTRFDTRQRFSLQVKQQESFRGFSPSVLDSHLDTYFSGHDGGLAADFMLLSCPLKDAALSQVLPAVVQHNLSTGAVTARVHRVTAAANPLFYRLIEGFRQRTGIGAVLNTSFCQSEPVVHSPEEALATFARSGMDWLAIGPYLVAPPGR